MSNQQQRIQQIKADLNHLTNRLEGWECAFNLATRHDEIDCCIMVMRVIENQMTDLRIEAKLVAAGEDPKMFDPKKAI